MSAGREKQRLIREVNARIRELNAGFGVSADTCVVLCECGAPGCLERIIAPIGASDGPLVAPGHEQAA